MKKILIALPLVLIMILSMIPVMAEGEETPKETCPAVDVYVYIRTWNNPSDLNKPTVKPAFYKAVTLTPTAEEMQDAKVLEDLILAEAALVQKPHNRVEEKNWKIVIREKVKALPKEAPAGGECQKDAVEYNVDIYPNCETEPDKPTDCPKVCDVINVVGIDVITGAEIAGKGYGVLPNQAPKFQYMLDDFSKTEIPANYRIVSNWFGQDWIDFPALLNSDCTIKVKLIPIRQKVTVIHELYDCCEELDGTKSYRLWKSFVEQGTSVDFIDYHSKLLVDKTRAKEFALTRLERVNAQDFVFQDAFFDDGVRLGGYLTGEIFDLDGNKIAGVKLEDKEPTIRLVYYHTNCVEKAEEKVDNAQVNAGNATTNTPVTQQLPATGAKDVTAFFMSAVALLGLGIFFAKKH